MKVSLFICLLYLSLSAFAADLEVDGQFSETDKQRFSVLIRNNHYLKPKTNQDNLENTAKLNQFLNTLDPYSKYFSAKEMKFKEKRSKKNRLGIGLDFLIEGEKILGVPVNNGPAFNNGFITPRYIGKINNNQIVPSNFESYQFLANFTLDQEVEVQTTTSKDLVKDNHKIKAQRFEQQHVTVKSLKKFNILTIRQFSEEATVKTRELLNSISSKKPLIIDLRHNPGGDLYATVDTLSFFLENDQTVAYLEERGISIPLHTLSDNTPPKRKIYLLLSNFTASSAEVFAQAIKHYMPQTVLVGLPTSGKCLAQEIYTLEKDAALQLSSYKVLNANKEFCQSKPIDIEIKIENSEVTSIEKIVSLLN